MESSTQCPPLRTLRELIEGRLPEPELTEYSTHLESCTDCQSRIQQLIPSDSLIKTLRNDAAISETITEKIPNDLMETLRRIPAMDSDGRLSIDTRLREGGFLLDDLGLSFLSPPQEPDEIGRLGHYRVFKVLGRGGMGVVFLAEDPKLGRRVALKVMLPKIASIPAARDRFLREAKAAASLKNDHIVTVYQVDEFNGVPFLAMELLQGESLEDALRAGKQFSIAETIQIARDVSKGLAVAHGNGLIHRDIKPANLWLETSCGSHSPGHTPANSVASRNFDERRGQCLESNAGESVNADEPNRRNILREAQNELRFDDFERVKILDFGLARAKTEDIHITEFGTIVGTPAFMAPEQARADRTIDGKADLFSLGCVLYLLCTGEIPFKADTTVGTLMALALQTPIDPKQRNELVPDELSRLIMQLLEKDPSKRPQSADQIADRLRHIERTIQSSVDTLTGAATLLGVSKPVPRLPQPVTELSQTTSQSVGNGIGRKVRVVAGICLMAVAAFVAQLLVWKTADGRIIRIECNDPSIMLALQGGELKVTGAYDQPIMLKPGSVDLKITKPQPDGTNFEFETDKLVVRKGEAIVLKVEVLDGEVRVVRDGQEVVDSKSLGPSLAGDNDSNHEGDGNSTPSSASVEQYETLIVEMRGANPGFDGNMIPRFEHGNLVSIDFKTDHVTDISPLRKLSHLRGLRMVGNSSPNEGVSDLSPLEGLPLTGFYAYYNARLSDLSPLKGMELQEVHIDGCPVTDLSPLAGMPIRVLWAWSWHGNDLSPLRGMPLTQLNIGGNGQSLDLSPLAGAPLEFICLNITKVSDVSPLRGMPLRRLLIENTMVSDISPLGEAKLEEFIANDSLVKDFSVLRGMPLIWAQADFDAQRDLELLREIKTLTRINNQRASDFLREFSDDRSQQTITPAFSNSIGMEFVKIPKGKAWLSQKVGESETTHNHETVIEDDFFLGMYEVTQEQWTKVMGSNPSWFARNADGATAVRMLPDDVLKRLPVERVSWTACQEFLRKLNELDSTPGWVYRLPTLAEHQYACRGGPMMDASEAAFDFCTTVRTNQLTADDANVLQQQVGWFRTCRVGLYPPNPLGLFDVHGNVWEWCHDAAPWREQPSRFISGGGWEQPAELCRVSDIRQPTEPWTYFDLGLRVARVPSP